MVIDIPLGSDGPLFTAKTECTPEIIKATGAKLGR